jgi:hypothetical protein
MLESGLSVLLRQNAEWERTRGGGYADMMERAADEIERLRAALRAVIDDTPMYPIDNMVEEQVRQALGIIEQNVPPASTPISWP